MALYQYSAFDISTIVTDTATYKAYLQKAFDLISGISVTNNKVMIIDGSGKIGTSTISSTQLGYLTGLVQNISTSFAEKGSLAVANQWTSKNDFDYFEIKQINHASSPLTSGTSGYWRMWICEDYNIHIIDNSGNEEIFVPSGHRSAEAWSATGDALPANLPNNVWAGITGFTPNTSTAGFVFSEGVPESLIAITGWVGSVATMTLVDNTLFTQGVVVTFHALSGGAGAAYSMGYVTHKNVDGITISVQFNTAGITHTAGYIVKPDQFKVSQGTAGNYNADYHISWTTNFAMHITTSFFKYNYGSAVGSLFTQAIKTTSKQYITTGECCNQTGFGISTEMKDGDVIFLAAQGSAISTKTATPTYGNIRITS